ncbi:integrase family protein [Methylocystis sp.]|uniref:tyrosine-type recombinase/integrase n=1 Tax=Methylocystis sp. TaxID=1911079 RepID=UPI0025D17E5E|nr:integrase family protein [Methylocystis sp.]
MANITKRLIDALKPSPDGRDLFIWDGALKGFGLRMKSSGSASFIIQYRTAQGQTRRHAFAKLGTLTPDEARTKARRLLGEVADGGDPSSARQVAREALTIAEVCDLYLEAARAGLVVTNKKRVKADSTLAVDEGRIARHIVPLLGKRVANELAGRTDILQRFYDDVAAGKTSTTIKTKARGVARVTGGAPAAKRAVGLFGGIWTWAAKRGLVKGANPARGVEMIADQTSERVLSAPELAKLGAALREHETNNPMPVAALRLIALTGLRANEACGLRWREIDVATQCVRLESTKTGKSMRPIGKAAIGLLGALPRLHGDFVFPNRDGTGHADLKSALADLFDAAGLHDARAQVLRRTFASVAADEGYGDATIGEMLGHARRGVTARHYIRRPDSALVEAADKVAARISVAMTGSDGDVVELPSANRERRGR